MKNRLEYVVVWMVVKTIQIMPFSMAQWVAGGLAFLANRVVGVRRELIRQNIRRAFPDRPEEYVDSIRGSSYRFFAHAAVEWLRMETVLENRTINERGWNHLNQYEDEGAIIVSGHIGYWELACAILGRRCERFTAYADRQENPYTEQLIQDIRGDFNIEPAEKGFTGIKGLFDRLKSGEYVGLLADQHVRNTYEYVPFFGEYVRVPRILSFLARKSGRPVVPMRAVKKDDATIDFRVFEPLPVSRKDGAVEEYEILKEYNEWLENQIRNYPEQYFWFHNRWKNSRKESQRADRS